MALKRNYYTVELPGDLFEDGDDWKERMCQQAISEAWERARLYIIPALWTAKIVSGDAGSWTVTIRVCRSRRS